MTCNKPLRGYRGPGGQVRFSRKGAWVDRPVTVSCGQCSGCRLQRSRSWAIRCIHEAKLHEKNCFITLTYNEQHLPKSGSLDVKHFQKFAKRVRKRIGKFRYLHCGEYGDENFRPHYHACIFGLDFSEDRVLYQQKDGYPTYTSKLLEETWGKGFCVVGNLNFQSAAYVARYVMKKITGHAALEHYRRLDPETGEEYSVLPEYVTMSRRPGLGAGWLEQFASDVYPDDFVLVENNKYQPPVFYDREMEKKDPVFMEAVKASRAKRNSKREFDSDRGYAREYSLNKRNREFTRKV